MARLPARLLCICLLSMGVALPLAGCGDDEAPADPPAATPGPNADGGPAWSGPAPGVGDAATGTPDGAEAGSADALLARLRGRVAGGRGMADQEYESDVRDVAEVLWPSDADPAARAGAQVHVQIAAIAAQVSGWLAEGENARAERTASNPIDVEIHDAFLKASAAGADTYRQWCEDAGATLLKKLAEARRAAFFPKRESK